VALALVFIPAMAIAAPWFVRNWTLYGDPLGMAMARQTVDLRTAPWTWNDTLWLLRGWFYSFWGKFGGAGHIPFPDWAYVLFGAALVAACAGLIFWLVHRPPATESAAGGVLALALLGTMLVIWQYSLVALGTDQGRLLYPALGAVVGLLAVGLLAWIPRRWDSPAVVGIIALVLGVGVYGLAGVVRPAFAPPPAAQPGQWQQQPATEWVTFGEIVLIQWDLRGQDPVLYWAAPQRPGRDWRVVLRVVAEDGTLVWEWKRSPGAGRLSTDRWPAEFVMRDVYRVRWPDWAGPTRYRVEVGAYPFGEDLVLPTRRGQPATAGRHPYVFLGWLTR
jgi:hypothetical protein